MTRRGVAVALITAAAACDVTSPVRTAAYNFDLGGAVFHWPQNRLPVRHYADPRGGGALPALVAQALQVWQAQFLYGEFRGVVVPDSGSADVIVVWADSVPPNVPPDTAGAVGACGGVTSFTVDSTDTIERAIRVEIRVSAGFTVSQVAACLPRVTRHELGHALGLLSHSPAVGDLMFGTPGVDLPSVRDRVTVEVLYHSPVTINPPPR